MVILPIHRNLSSKTENSQRLRGRIIIFSVLTENEEFDVTRFLGGPLEQSYV